MLDVGIIELVEESEWIHPIVVQDKKTTSEVCIYVDLRKMKDSFLHDPFPTLFRDEVLESVKGQEVYYFTYGFFGYHHIIIAKEDRHKINFAMEWGCFQYTVMPFGLKNAPTIFSKIVLVAFKDFIHKFFEVYFND